MLSLSFLPLAVFLLSPLLSDSYLPSHLPNHLHSVTRTSSTTSSPSSHSLFKTNSLLSPSSATTTSTASSSTALSAGGWGKKAKDFSPAEMTTDTSIDNAPVESYELQPQRDFMARVIREKKAMKKRQEEEFVKVALAAGLLDSQTEGEATVMQPLGKFSAEDDDEELDMRFYENPEEMEVKKNSLDGFEEPQYDKDGSITRLDGANDVSKYFE